MELVVVTEYILVLYLVIGVLFYFPFVKKGINIIDAGAKGSSWGFKVIILPGVILLWPVLFNKWVKKIKINDKAT